MKGIRKDAPGEAELAELRILARAASWLIRHRSNINQAELARRCRCYQQAISLVELGRPGAPVRVLRELIAAADIERADASNERLDAIREKLDAVRAELLELERQAEIVEQGASA